MVTSSLLMPSLQLLNGMGRKPSRQSPSAPLAYARIYTSLPMDAA